MLRWLIHAYSSTHRRLKNPVSDGKRWSYFYDDMVSTGEAQSAKSIGEAIIHASVVSRGGEAKLVLLSSSSFTGFNLL